MDPKNVSTIITIILGIGVIYLLFKEFKNRPTERKPTIIYVPSKPQIVKQYIPEYIPDFNYDYHGYSHHHHHGGGRNRDIIINNNNNNENIIHNRVLPINNIPLIPNSGRELLPAVGSLKRQIPMNPSIGTINHNHPSF